MTVDKGTLPGTRPQGVESESEAARHVRGMFSRIAPRYDLLNHLLSLDLDRLWRWCVARRLRRVLSSQDASVLDLCCRTGDLAAAFRRAGPARVYGADFAHPMLTRAIAKARASEAAASVTRTNDSYAEADALQLPFLDASFDLVASDVGFRNWANYDKGLREIRRILKPGGVLAILEFSEPKSRMFAPLFRWYFRSLLPRIGAAISGDCAAYPYLPASVSRFPSAEELAERMREVGFCGARFELWTGGIVALHTAVRPAVAPE